MYMYIYNYDLFNLINTAKINFKNYNINEGCSLLPVQVSLSNKRQ